MPSDPKKNIVDGRRRLLTIHDGARLTPTLVRLLDGLADEANALREERPSSTSGRGNASTYTLDDFDPILVARKDGIAVYVPTSGRLA